MWPMALLTFACCFWGLYFLMVRLMAPRLAVTDRLAHYSETFRKPERSARWSRIPAADRAMNRVKFARSIELLLDQADLPIKPFELLLILVVAGLAASVIGLLFLRQGLGAVGLIGIAGCLIPVVWVYLKRSRRRQAFTRQIPDALQAISNSLRAGFGFGQGMTVVASDLPAPISVEFARAQREMNLGLTVDEVLQNMARRMQSRDFDLAVSGILINRQVGGNLAELLDQINATIRERVKLKTFIRVITAQQRLSAWIVMIVPLLLMGILLLGLRDYTSYLITTSIGHVMMIVAVCLQLLGAYAINRIVAIDV